MKNVLLASALGFGLALGFASPAAADDDEKRSRADHTTFTSETENLFVCGCPRRNVCRVHATISNFGGGSDRVDIKFQDGDLVTIFVPAGTTHSLTQMMGTRNDKDVDDVVIFDPQTGPNANPIVAWVSIERLGDGKKNDAPEFGCTTFPYGP